MNCIGDRVQQKLAAHIDVLRVIEVPAGMDRPSTRSFLVTPSVSKATNEEMDRFFNEIQKVLPCIERSRGFTEIGGAFWFGLIHLRSHHSNPPDRKVVYIDHVELRLLPDDALVQWVAKTDHYCINPHDMNKILWINKKLPWISKMFQKQ